MTHVIASPIIEGCTLILVMVMFDTNAQGVGEHKDDDDFTASAE